MPTIRERAKADGSPIFHVQVRMSGFPARTASFPTRRLAERWAKTIEAGMIEGRHFRNVEARRCTLADAIDRYIEEELPKKRDARTRVIRLRWWKEKLGHLKLADITPAVLVEYRGKLAKEPYTRARPGTPGSTLEEGEAARQFKRTPTTVRAYLAYLRHVLSIARREWHWLSYNPFDGVGMPTPGAGRVRVLDEAERKALLAQTSKDPQLHLLVMLALSTAARAGELLSLTWGDVDLKDGRLLLRVTKNTQPRVVWVHGEALKLLKEYGKVRTLGEERVFVSAKGKAYDYRPAFEAACTAAGITGAVFHSLRHTAATMLAREGATEQQLKAIGGWKSGVVSRYVHLAAEDARAVQRKMTAKILGK
ncbi:MAG TPA: site-specific integrase [Steroidobacteraceae bacterium]|nr:site-specific integrase [Steroidobacteraceae bacterium]